MGPGAPLVNEPTNLADLLLAHRFADDEPLLFGVDPPRTIDAGTARAMALDTSHALRNAGVSAGQSVAVQLPDTPETITTMIGIWDAGCVFVPVNPRYPEAE